MAQVPFYGISSWCWSRQRPRPWSPPGCSVWPRLTPTFRKKRGSNLLFLRPQLERWCALCWCFPKKITWVVMITNLQREFKSLQWNLLKVIHVTFLSELAKSFRDVKIKCQSKLLHNLFLGNERETSICHVLSGRHSRKCFYCTFSISCVLFSLISTLTGMWGNFLKTSSSRAIFLSLPVL